MPVQAIALHIPRPAGADAAHPFLRICIAPDKKPRNARQKLFAANARKSAAGIDKITPIVP